MIFLARLALGGLGFLKRLPWQLWAILGALLCVWLLWSAHVRAVKVAREQGQVHGAKIATETFRRAQDEADQIERARVAKIEARDVAIQQEKSVALENALTRARADAARYGRLLAQSRSGSAGAKHLPAAPEAASASAYPDPQTFLDDLNICGENTAKAAGWSDWWAAIEKVRQGDK